MQEAGIELANRQVAEGLAYRVIHGKDGNPVVVATVNISQFSEKYKDLNGDYPLFIATRNENGRWEWRRTYLQDYIGFSNTIQRVRTVVAVTGDEYKEWKEPRFTYIPRNFNAFTIPYNYSTDTITHKNRDVEFRVMAAQELGSQDVLVIELSDLEDIDVQNFSSFNDLMNEVRKRQLEAYRLFTKINNGNNMYVVLNEIHPGTGVYDLWKIYGDRFISGVFRSAREIISTDSPNAKLLYSETYNYA